MLKQSAGEELIAAMQEVLEGRTYLTPLITKDVMATLTESMPKPAVKLTPRQREVLRLIAEGRRMKEIAAILELSTRTVETHKYEIMRGEYRQYKAPFHVSLPEPRQNVSWTALQAVTGRDLPGVLGRLAGVG